jgi:hypothetical protein
MVGLVTTLSLQKVGMTILLVVQEMTSLMLGQETTPLMEEMDLIVW